MPALSLSPVISLPGRLDASPRPASPAVQLTLYVYEHQSSAPLRGPGAHGGLYLSTPHWVPQGRKQGWEEHLPISQSGKLRQEAPEFFSDRHRALSSGPPCPLPSLGLHQPYWPLFPSPQSLNPQESLTPPPGFRPAFRQTLKKLPFPCCPTYLQTFLRVPLPPPHLI